LKAISLQSGSNGNCIFVETGDVRLLFDAGIPGAVAERRLAAFGLDIRSVDAVIISHDHADHVCNAGVYQRKYGIPLFITPGTLAVSERTHRLGKLSEVNLFFRGGTIRIGNVRIQTVPTPHDGEDGSAFIVLSGEKRLGIMTDLGHIFGGLQDAVSLLDAVFLESNYDPGMLARGPYPEFLKRRIKGPGGHLSNIEAAELLLAGKRLKWACLSHLSARNNDAVVAMKTHREIVPAALTLYTAGRHAATPLLKV